MDPLTMVLTQIAMSGVKSALTPPQVQVQTAPHPNMGGGGNPFDPNQAPSPFSPPKPQGVSTRDNNDFLQSLLMMGMPFAGQAVGNWVSGLGMPTFDMGGIYGGYKPGYGNMGGQS